MTHPPAGDSTPDTDATEVSVRDDEATLMSAPGAGRTAATQAVPGGTVVRGDPGPIAAGTVLGHTYEVEAVLGRGGMGQVFRARHVALQTQHAIKVIVPELAENGKLVDLFKREAAVLRQVRHDAVVAYDGINRDEFGRLFLVMEFVDGPSLSKLLRAGPLTEADVGRLLDRVAAGLAAAHAKGVVHRDISPDNIILTGGRIDGAKIIDFGIAKQLAAEAGTIIGDSFAGKYAYASPEQLGMFGGAVDARSDIYSVGLVLVHAATGRRLDMGETPQAVLERRRSVPDLGGLTPALKGIVARMLAPDPKDRPASIESLIGAFEAAARSGGRGAGKKSPVAALVVGGVALAAAAGGAAFLLMQPEAPAPVPPVQEAKAPEPAPVTLTTPRPADAEASKPAEPAPAKPADAAAAKPPEPIPAKPAEPIPAKPPEPIPTKPPEPIPAKPVDTAVAKPAEPAPPPTPPQAAPTVQAAVPADAAAAPVTPPPVSPPAPTPKPEPAGLSPGGQAAVQPSVADSLLTPAKPVPAPTPAPPPAPAVETVTASEPARPAPAATTAGVGTTGVSTTAADTTTVALAAPPPPPNPAQLKARIEETFRGFSCAGLDAVAEGGGFAVAGFVGSDADAASLRQRLAGLNLPAAPANRVAVRPRPFCDVLGFAALRASATLPAGQRLQLALNNPAAVYRDGDTLKVTLKAGERGGHLTVDYFDLDGNAIHMVPMPLLRDGSLRPGQTVTIGADPATARSDQRFYTISPPYGPGMIVAFLTDQPLFPANRPEVEPAAAYVGALRNAVAKAPGARPLAESAFFETRPR